MHFVIACDNLRVNDTTLTSPDTIRVNKTTLTSPNYPSNYDTDYVNEWRLTVNESLVVALQIDDFHLEDTPIYEYDYESDYYSSDEYENEPCSYDWVRVSIWFGFE